MMKNFSPATSAKLIGIAAVLFLAGCASVPPPIEQMAASRAAVGNANSSGAEEFAPVLLKSAKEKMVIAERAMTERNYELARQQAEQAQVEAQLAAEMARTAKAKKAADALQEDSRILRQELIRKTK